MEIHLKYINPQFHIGLTDLRHAWLLLDPPVPLAVAVHQCNLVYRLPKNGARISYRQLKKGLLKTNRIITLPNEPQLF